MQHSNSIISTMIFSFEVQKVLNMVHYHVHLNMMHVISLTKVSYI